MNRAIACACLALSMALVGANVPFTKDIAAYIPPLHFTLARFVIASAALAPLILWRGAAPLAGLMRAAGLRITAMAVIGMIGFTLFLIAGLARTSATDAGVIMATLPGMVTVLGIVLLRDRPTVWQWLGVMCAVLGVAIIQLGAGVGESGDLVGNLLILCAVACEAGFVILAKRLAERHDGVALAFLANAVAGVLMVPVVLLSAETLQFDAVPGYIWPLLIWYALAASVISLLLWYRGLPHVDTSVAGIMTAALPVSALVVSALYLGETIELGDYVGAMIVIAGIFIGSRSRVSAPLP